VGSASWRTGWAATSRTRAAYDEARTLYKQVGDRLGEANVLFGLGELESKLGRNEQARAAYDDARTLYKQEGNRLGEANVLSGLGTLCAL
jgi:tetratricopeptide (TPR) repeat protein